MNKDYWKAVHHGKIWAEGSAESWFERGADIEFILVECISLRSIITGQQSYSVEAVDDAG